MPLSQGVFGVAFSPDGRTVAVINPNLEIWSVADPAHPRRLGYSKGDIVTGADPAFSPNGRVLATSGQQNVILWNVTDPEPRPAQIAVLSAYSSGVSAVLFSPDGHLLASGYDDGTVVLWNTADPAAPVVSAAGRFPASPPPPPGAGLLPGAALAFSASEHTLTTIAGNSTVTVWNVPGRGGLARVTTSPPDTAADPWRSPPAGARWPGPTTGDTLALWTLP
jgi:WD40 repeat protein